MGPHPRWAGSDPPPALPGWTPARVADPGERMLEEGPWEGTRPPMQRKIPRRLSPAPSPSVETPLLPEASPPTQMVQPSWLLVQYIQLRPVPALRVPSSLLPSSPWR